MHTDALVTAYSATDALTRDIAVPEVAGVISTWLSTPQIRTGLGLDLPEAKRHRCPEDKADHRSHLRPRIHIPRGAIRLCQDNLPYNLDGIPRMANGAQLRRLCDVIPQNVLDASAEGLSRRDILSAFAPTTSTSSQSQAAPSSTTVVTCPSTPPLLRGERLCRDVQ